MKNSTTTNKYPLPTGKEWFRLPERIKSFESNTTKSYVGLITQTGSHNTVVWNTPLVIGNTYIVGFLQSPDDFSNVGYVENDVPFVATGTTPTSWGQFASGVIEVNPSASPSIEVIENTLGITLTASCRNSTSFFLNSNLPVFLQNKTLLSPAGCKNSYGIAGFGMVRLNDYQLVAPVFSLGITEPFTVEIKVYN